MHQIPKAWRLLVLVMPIGGGCKPLHLKGSACAPPIKCNRADFSAGLCEQAHTAPHPHGLSAAVLAINQDLRVLIR